MRKLYAVLLLAVLILGLSGCGLGSLKNVELPPLPQVTEKVVSPKPTPEPSPTPEPTPEPSPEATEEIPLLKAESLPEEPLGLEGQVVIRFKHTAYEQFDPEEGKQKILSFSYDTPYVNVEGFPQVSAAINGQIAFMDESYYTGSPDGEPLGYNAMLEMAEDNYAYIRQSGDKSLPGEYSSSRTVKTARVDNRVISLVFSFDEYIGGSHGNYGNEACVFDARTGELLHLEDLCSDYETFKSRLLHCLVTLTESDKSLYDHVYISYMNGDYYATLGKLLRQGSWYFDENGMVIFSDLYELGPYIAGIAEFKIPYSKLTDCLDEKWLPETRTESGKAQISADLQGDGSTAFLDRVEADEKGTELCIKAEGTLYSVKLSRVHLSDKFYEDEQLWFCSEMKDSALQVLTEIPDKAPNLRLSYRDQDGSNHKLLITKDQKDGSLRLVKEKDYLVAG